MTAKPATAREIREIFTNADDDMVLAILDTGATTNEILQASAWLLQDDVIGGDLQRPMNATVRKIFDILHEDRDRWTDAQRA